MTWVKLFINMLLGNVIAQKKGEFTSKINEVTFEVFYVSRLRTISLCNSSSNAETTVIISSDFCFFLLKTQNWKTSWKSSGLHHSKNKSEKTEGIFSLKCTKLFFIKRKHHGKFLKVNLVWFMKWFLILFSIIFELVFLTTNSHRWNFNCETNEKLEGKKNSFCFKNIILNWSWALSFYEDVCL